MPYTPITRRAVRIAMEVAAHFPDVAGPQADFRPDDLLDLGEALEAFASEPLNKHWREMASLTAERLNLHFKCWENPADTFGYLHETGEEDKKLEFTAEFLLQH